MDYASLMVRPIANPNDEQDLRQVLHAKLDQLSAPRLSELSRIVRQWELEELGQKLDEAFDQDRREGKLSDEKISDAIAEHRAQHPYGR